MTTKKSDPKQIPTDGLDDSLFADLELDTPNQPSPPSTPAEPLILESSRRDISTQRVSPRVKRSQKKTTSALKVLPAEKKTNPLVWILIVLIVLTGLGGGAYFLGLIPNFSPTPPAPSVTPRPKAPITRQILLKTTPSMATITLNGKQLDGLTPQTLTLKSQKLYTIELSKENCQPLKFQLTLAAGQTKKIIQKSLKCEQPKAPTTPAEKPEKAPQDRPAPKTIGGIGYIKLSCKPTFAKVQIGDNLKATCTDSAKLPFEAGEYELIIAAKGYQTHRQKLIVTAKKILNVNVNLKRTNKRRIRRGKGTLKLSSKPRAAVYWRGRKIGKTPLTYRFPAGRLRLLLKTAFGSRKTLRLRIKHKQTLTKKVIFPKGTLKFLVKPWADIYINGKKKGQTPLPPQRLPEGVYRVEMRMHKKQVKRIIRLYAGKTIRIKYTFKR